MIKTVKIDPSIKEEWKDIEGYEGLYQVSNTGKIKSLRNNIILKPMISNNGYYWVDLRVGGSRKHARINRLVAKAFVSNPNNYPEVNHLDENTINNQATNLEWCTRKYNVNYGTRTARQVKTSTGMNGIPIIQLSLDWKPIKTWVSAGLAGKQYSGHQHIAECAKGLIRTYKGYHWLYKDDYDLWMNAKTSHEIWQPIPDYGNYLISNFGDIVTTNKQTISSYSLKGSNDLLVKLTDSQGNKHSYHLDQLVALAFIPNADTFKGIKHRNGSSIDNRVANLVEDTNLRKQLGNKSISKALMGHSVSTETRNKISRAHTGMKLSNRTRSRLAQAHTGLKQSRATVQKRISKTSKPIVQLSIGGSFIKQWASAKAVTNELGYDGSSITKCCRGKLGKTHNYCWVYLSDYKKAKNK